MHSVFNTVLLSKVLDSSSSSTVGSVLHLACTGTQPSLCAIEWFAKFAGGGKQPSATFVGTTVGESHSPVHHTYVLCAGDFKAYLVNVLSVTQWKALVGSDTFAAAPLQNMPCLKCVLVDKVQGPAFNVAGLNFKTVQY